MTTDKSMNRPSDYYHQSCSIPFSSVFFSIIIICQLPRRSSLSADNPRIKTIFNSEFSSAGHEM